jgi:hypothetical protein
VVNVVACVEVFVLVERAARARLAAVVEDFVVRVVFFAVIVSSENEPLGLRKRVWRDDTVASEHVDVERTACFTDSTEESGRRAATVMVERCRY